MSAKCCLGLLKDEKKKNLNKKEPEKNFNNKHIKTCYTTDILFPRKNPDQQSFPI